MNMKNYLNELTDGLDQGYLNAMFLYDDVGSELYRQRVAQPDYYLYRKERELISEISHLFSGDKMLDIGSGVTDKLDPIKKNYNECWALDIDPESAKASSDKYIVDSFLTHQNDDKDAFFMGSTCSNLTDNQIYQIIKNNRDIVIAVDIAKDEDVMVKAYTDPKGIGENMEKQGLRNINKWFGLNFPVEDMTYECRWNPVTFIVETNLIFNESYGCFIGSKGYHWKKGDKIRIGQLRKLMIHQWEWLFNQAGKVTNIYTTKDNWYAIYRVTSS